MKGVRDTAEPQTPEQSQPRGAAALIRHVSLVLASHPEWLAWCGLAVALLCIYQSLGLADPGIISRWMTGDTLWLVNVFTDLFHDGYSLAGWHFSIAPCWFPDVAAAGLFWGITRNVIVATLLAGFIQVGIIVAALHVIGKVLGVRSLALQDSILLLVGTAIALYVARDPGSDISGIFSILFTPDSRRQYAIGPLGLGSGIANSLPSPRR